MENHNIYYKTQVQTDFLHLILQNRNELINLITKGSALANQSQTTVTKKKNISLQQPQETLNVKQEDPVLPRFNSTFTTFSSTTHCSNYLHFLK